MQNVSSKLIIIVLAVLAGVVSVFAYFNAASYGNRAEQALKARQEDNENVYANGTQAVIEIAQVPAMYTKDLKEIVTADIQGRYGQNGSQATMQWLKERGIPMDPGMYKAIQQQILAFRGKFEIAQTALVDQKRSYETALGSPWDGFWLARAGYPKIDLADYKIVSTSKARKTFETKIDDGITLRPAQ